MPMTPEQTTDLTFKKMSSTRAGITVGGIVLNVLLSMLAHSSGCPLYLDTIGTVVVAGTCGTAWGILTALVSSIICDAVGSGSMYFSIVAVIIAIVTARLFYREKMNSARGIIKLVTYLALIGGVMGVVLAWLLYRAPSTPWLAAATEQLTAIANLPALPALMIANLGLNVVDKAVSAAIALLIIRAIPADIRAEMHEANKRLRVASGLDRRAGELDKESRGARHRRLLVMIAVLAITLMVVIAWISVGLYTDKARQERTECAIGAAKLAATAVDGDKMDLYLREGAQSSDYRHTQEVLSNILRDMNNVEYLYVYQPQKDGLHIVFDLDETSSLTTEVGTVTEYEPGLVPWVSELLAGERIEPFESNDSWGWLLSYYEPIYNNAGECVAYAGADVSLSDLQSSVNDFVLRIFLIGAGFLLLTIAFGMRISADYHRADEWQALMEKQEQEKLLTKEIVEAFAKTIDMKDRYTNGHSFRVARYTELLARELDFDDETAKRYYNIALLHDIGKIGIPVEVLNKPEDPTDEEYKLIKSHAQKGYDALKDISLMPELAIGAGMHHERWDGQGYPQGLKGDEIPKVAQIIAVADTFDAMYSDRPYRKRMDFDEALNIVRRVSGTQLAPDVVKAFLRLVKRGDIGREEGGAEGARGTGGTGQP